MAPRVLALLRLLTVAPLAGAGQTPLCRTPEECGLADGYCGSNDVTTQLVREQFTTVCVFFQGQDGNTAAGQKALFEVRVDKYTTLSVDTLRTLMGAQWAAKEPYSMVWVCLLYTSPSPRDS